MMNYKKPPTIIKSGGELTREELETINLYRRSEFGAKEETRPESGNGDWRNKYFLIKDGQGGVLAFGVIRPAQIQFQQKIYSILEFVSLVSIKKGEGYGSSLMEQMKKYAEVEGKTLIGFCTSDMVPFYQKNGLETTMGLPDRFEFIKDELSFPGETPGEAVYVGGEDKLIEELSKFPQETAYIYRHKS